MASTHNGIPDDFWREVPCGHPPDPVAMWTDDGEPICHCGHGLKDASVALDPEAAAEAGAPGPVVLCSKCGCHPAIPPKPESKAPASTDVHEGRTAALVNVKRMAQDLENAEAALGRAYTQMRKTAKWLSYWAGEKDLKAAPRWVTVALSGEAKALFDVISADAPVLDAGEPEPTSVGSEPANANADADFVGEGGGDGRPDRTNAELIRFLRGQAGFERRHNGQPRKADVLDACAERIDELRSRSAPVDREARIEKALAVFLEWNGPRSAPRRMDRVLAERMADALSGVVSSGEGTPDLNRASDDRYVVGRHQDRTLLVRRVDGEGGWIPLHDLWERPSSGLPDEPSALSNVERKALIAAAEHLRGEAETSIAMESLLGDAKQERDDAYEARDEARGELRSLRRELATMLGPIKPREGVTENALWIAKVGDVLRERDEALKGLVNWRRAAEDADMELTRLRAAVPLSTDVLRKPPEAMVEAQLLAEGAHFPHDKSPEPERTQNTTRAGLTAVADFLDEHRPTPERFAAVMDEIVGEEKCARCSMPRSEHVPGPARPPRGDTPYCCNRFLESQSPPSPAGDGDDGLDVDELRVVVDFPTASEVGAGDKLWSHNTFRVVEKAVPVDVATGRVNIEFEASDEGSIQGKCAAVVEADQLVCRSVGRFRPSPAVGLTVAEAEAVIRWGYGQPMRHDIDRAALDTGRTKLAEVTDTEEGDDADR